MDYHIQIYKGEKYFIGFCDEIPGAMTQGESLDEVKENMKEAIMLIRKPIVIPEFAGQTPMLETIAI